MSSIIPIPTSRVTGLLTRQRLTQQYQADQLDLFRLQEQISTGQRISLPSEDAPAALRAISLQRLLSRKGQLETNIQSGLRFLASTGRAISGVAGKLSEIKASALGVVGTVATDAQRDAAILEINGALHSLVGLGNEKFNGRYIFSGSQTNQQPYSFEDGNVVYHGDYREVRSFSDLGVLFASNVTGQDVFGGVSEAVRGSVDLNPQLNADTLLTSLRGGRGINPNGSLQIADAITNEIAVVDLSGASTVGDVVRLIEDNPPSGRTIDVSITGSGLTLKLDSGNLIVSEVGTGTTARELGLLGAANPSTTVTGEDLDPQILKTSRLEDLLGTKARTTLKSGADNNDILVEAAVNGTALNDVTIEVVDGGDIGATATVVYDDSNPLDKRLTIFVDDTGDTTANHVVDAINANGTFTAELDLVDSSSPADSGTGAVALGVSPDKTSGGLGETLDQTSGIRVVNGGNTFDISFGTAESVEDLLNILNSSEAGLLAEINAAGNGIDVRSRLSGNDFQIGEIGGGTTATQLGLRTFREDSRLSDFNYGVGVPTKTAVQANITHEILDLTTSDGQPLNVDLSGVANVGDAIIAINNAAAALAVVNVTAQADPSNTNVLQLTDGTEGAGRLSILQTGPDLAINGGIDFSIPAADLSITAGSGASFTIDITGAETVQDVLDLINLDAGNAGLVTARLAESGNGIELEDTSLGAGDLTVTALEGSDAAQALGLVDKGDTVRSSSTGTLTGTDPNFLETDSIFTTLVRLRDALEADDPIAIGRAVAGIDADIQRVTFAQADVGARYQGLQLTHQNLQDEVIQLRSALSDEIDVDLLQAISDLTARQISLEASLRVTANILQLSLLNFI